MRGTPKHGGHVHRASHARDRQAFGQAFEHKRGHGTRPVTHMHPGTQRVTINSQREGEPGGGR